MTGYKYAPTLEVYVTHEDIHSFRHRCEMWIPVGRK